MVLQFYVALPLVAGCQRKLFAGRLLCSCQCTAKQRKCLWMNRGKRHEFPLEKNPHVKSPFFFCLTANDFPHSQRALPGPLAFLSVMRPSLKITARSYSWTICGQSTTQASVCIQNLQQNRKWWFSAPLPHCSADFLSILTFTQNQMVMGKRRAAKKPDTMTMNQPMHPSDPVRSAGDRKR